ncbi:hypothetical protein APA_4706 [Pseudanabaena sp. lw0831]|nr:hypothetical protein APA_4706 [Pseudanabaena sp. lw0831]
MYILYEKSIFLRFLKFKLRALSVDQSEIRLILSLTCDRLVEIAIAFL